MSIRNTRGALPDFELKRLIDSGFFGGVSPSLVNPASLDLAITGEVFRVPGIFFPQKGEVIAAHLRSQGSGSLRHNLSSPLEKDVTYAIRIDGKIRLPRGIYGYANPKSTTGRTDTHVRLIADREYNGFDHIGRGWSGKLWALVTPKSFPISLEPGMRLTQVRFFNGDSRFSSAYEAEVAHEKHPLFWNRRGAAIPFEHLTVDRDGSVIMTIGLSDEIPGYECTQSNKVFSFSAQKGYYHPDDFFSLVRWKKVLRNRELVRTVDLLRGHFYIFTTKERLLVPPDLACEMRPMDERFGEFRTHYAGFIDAGWGWGKNGEGKGRTITLEVRPYEDVTVVEGRPFARVRFERMVEVPEIPYDATGTYVVQDGPRLAKQFRRR